MNWPSNIKATYSYLRRPDVRDAFHVDVLHKPEPWVECSARVGRALNLAPDPEPASVTLLPMLLDNGIRVLLFAGDQDLICNHVGLERMLDHLTWGGLTGFSAPAANVGDPWSVNDNLMGRWHTERNLTYVRVYNASHMVPLDMPVASHDMILRFMGAAPLQAAGPLAIISSRVGSEAGHIWASANASGPNSSESLKKAVSQARREAYLYVSDVARNRTTDPQNLIQPRLRIGAPTGRYCRRLPLLVPQAASAPSVHRSFRHRCCRARPARCECRSGRYC